MAWYWIILHEKGLRVADMNFLELFVTASVPVLNVLLVTGVGSFIATDYIGILHEEARKNLNNVSWWFIGT